jgi:hypothetical protein
MAEVRLVDLMLIKRYSLAVRQEWAEADEVLAALDASREQVLAALGRAEAPRARRTGTSARPRRPR